MYTATDLSPDSISRRQRRQRIGLHEVAFLAADELDFSYDQPLSAEGASKKEDSRMLMSVENPGLQEKK